MRYGNIAIFLSLSAILAHSEKTQINYFFGDNNLYMSSLDTIYIDYNIQMTRELEWATRLIQAESLNEPEEGKIAVVQTILNRVEYNTARGRNTSLFWEISRPGQVDGYRTKYWYKPLKRENILIAYKALYGERIIPNTVYFWHNARISTDRKHVRWAEGKNGELIYKTIGDHTFCHSKWILKNHPNYERNN